MNALVVYESVYGNTRAVAEAIADGLGGAEAIPVHEAVGRGQEVELLLVGGPTHVHGMSTPRSRDAAVQAAGEDGADHHLEPGATTGPGLRAWIDELPERDGGQAAAFDTRADKPAWLTGSASHGIAKRLRRHGYSVVGTESFRVESSEGPVLAGELDRARAWGAGLAKVLSAPGRSATSTAETVRR